MQIAVIGLGGIARKAFLPVLGLRPDVEVIPSSRTAASIEEIQRQYRFSRSAQSVDDVIRARPQAAFVLTPKETHFEIAGRLLEAGIDVFLEKPATMRSSEIRALAEQAARHERVLMVGFNRRFAPLHVRAKQLLDGRPASSAVIQKFRGSPSSHSLFDLLIEDSIHYIDILRFFCGEAEAAAATVHFRENKVISTTISLALEQGGTAVIASNLHSGGWSESYALHGSGQSVLIDAFASLRHKTPDGETCWQETYASSWKTTLDGRGFTDEIDHFIQCVQKREQPQTSGWEALKTQLLVEQIVAKAAGAR